MSKKKKLMAIAYDFDGTLAPGNMPEHSFIPEVGIKKPRRFWDEAKAYASKNDMDEILSYMHLMLKKADQNEIAVKKESFLQHGKRIPFFNGVRGWFSRINKYASSKGIRLEHYIISSGLREMIEGTSISKKIEYIFASGFMYNQNNVAVWPALAINYTT